MQAEKLKQIQQSIRENWGKVRPFKTIPKNNFNCYMFAVCNTVPTEILICNDIYISTIGESISYFGCIGNISGTTYKTLEEYKQAFINDLRVLGISAQECFEDVTTITEDSMIIAFFSNFEEGISVADLEFHFLRFIPYQNRWMGKEGFHGELQKIKQGYPIEQVNVIDQKRIGIFRLKLIKKIR